RMNLREVSRNFIYCPTGRPAEKPMTIIGHVVSEVESINPEVRPYINRLSSFLFVLARAMNKKEGVPEEELVDEGTQGSEEGVAVASHLFDLRL
ncbi:MAG TPA: hypothetical protein VNA15_08450, partial [Candidatus Angelobacter sp.]|nr:hypothetical protein [Candidatus Angelobacter sp.]